MSEHPKSFEDKKLLLAEEEAALKEGASAGFPATAADKEWAAALDEKLAPVVPKVSISLGAEGADEFTADFYNISLEQLNQKEEIAAKKRSMKLETLSLQNAPKCRSMVSLSSPGVSPTGSIRSAGSTLTVGSSQTAPHGRSLTKLGSKEEMKKKRAGSLSPGRGKNRRGSCRHKTTEKERAELEASIERSPQSEYKIRDFFGDRPIADKSSRRSAAAPQGTSETDVTTTTAVAESDPTTDSAVAENDPTTTAVAESDPTTDPGATATTAIDESDTTTDPDATATTAVDESDTTTDPASATTAAVLAVKTEAQTPSTPSRKKKFLNLLRGKSSKTSAATEESKKKKKKKKQDSSPDTQKSTEQTTDPIIYREKTQVPERKRKIPVTPIPDPTPSKDVPPQRKATPTQQEAAAKPKMGLLGEDQLRKLSRQGAIEEDVLGSVLKSAGQYRPRGGSDSAVAGTMMTAASSLFAEERALMQLWQEHERREGKIPRMDPMLARGAISRQDKVEEQDSIPPYPTVDAPVRSQSDAKRRGSHPPQDVRARQRRCGRAELAPLPESITYKSYTTCPDDKVAGTANPSSTSKDSTKEQPSSTGKDSPEYRRVREGEVDPLNSTRRLNSFQETRF